MKDMFGREFRKGDFVLYSPCGYPGTKVYVVRSIGTHFLGVSLISDASGYVTVGEEVKTHIPYPSRAVALSQFVVPDREDTRELFALSEKYKAS